MTTIKQFRDPQLITDGSVVGFYEREFYVFSNFSSFQVDWQDRHWATSEHAYQAARFFGVAEDLVEEVHRANSAHEAWEIAGRNKHRQRDNWVDIKSEVMLDICRHKLQQNSYVRHKLAQTNEEYLVEDSPVDGYWGWGADRQGHNELGKVWMTLRKELAQDDSL
jgi:N-glycosidase YbiA